MEAKLTTTLADALQCFSLDLVKIVRNYLLCPSASAGAKPKHQLTISTGVCDYERVIREIHGLACAPDNTIWVSCHDHVRVYSEDGKNQRTAVSWLLQAAGIAFNDKGDAHIIDARACTVVLCRADRSVLAAQPLTQLPRPYHLAIDSSNSLTFITDDYRVVALDALGSVVRGWGKPTGNFAHYRCIVLTNNGDVAVTDFRNDRVHVFDADGMLLRTFGGSGLPKGGFSGPVGLATNSANQFFVCDQNHSRVQVFSSEGAYITEFGVYGEEAGCFNCPRYVCVDREGRVLVSDRTGRIQAFGFEF